MGAQLGGSSLLFRALPTLQTCQVLSQKRAIYLVRARDWLPADKVERTANVQESELAADAVF